MRVQIGRLRQKLEEFYRTEGATDPILIELSKRQFTLRFHQQSAATVDTLAAVLPKATPAPVTANEPAVLTQTQRRNLSWSSLLLGALLATLLATLVWGGWNFWRAGEAERSQPASAAVSPDISELWQPFLNSDRPVTVAITMRPFLRYEHGAIWDWSLKRLPQEEQEARVAELKRKLNTQVLVPWEKTYTTFGEATGIFAFNHWCRLKSLT